MASVLEGLILQGAGTLRQAVKELSTDMLKALKKEQNGWIGNLEVVEELLGLGYWRQRTSV